MKSCFSGFVFIMDFEDMYFDFFEGDVLEFVNYVFCMFDLDKSGFIDFKEFMYLLLVILWGNLEEKLEWVFKIYDVDGDGFVIKYEMEFIIRLVYKMYIDGWLGKKEMLE